MQIILSNRVIEYADEGSGPVVLMLHGWGGSLRVFDPFIAWLMPRYRVIRVDLPGFGGSELPKTAWDIDDYATFIRDFIDKLQIRVDVMVGHSFGGNIAIKYSAKNADVRKLILIGSAGIRGKTLKKSLYFILAKALKAVSFLPGLSKLRERVRRAFYSAIGAEDYIQAGALTEIYRKNIGEDLRRDMEKIKVPTTLIWGEQDDAVPLAQGQRTHKFIKGSELFIVPRAGHYAFLDNPADFENIFLQAIRL